MKTAFYGEDANWGHIMAALGRAEIEMQEEKVDIWIDYVQLVAGGLGLGAEAEARATARLKGKSLSLRIDLHQGAAREELYTRDPTHDYVSINAHYRT